MNIGTNPTTDSDNKLKLEVNIFNFDKEIYGSTLKVEFLERIRDEQKFNSVKELVENLETDENKCKELLKKINLS
jgi:riboflavin kinase/FMN adenylyltransferase